MGRECKEEVCGPEGPMAPEREFGVCEAKRRMGHRIEHKR